MIEEMVTQWISTYKKPSPNMVNSMIFLDRLTERPAILCNGRAITARSSAILLVAFEMPKALKFKQDPSVSPCHLVQMYDTGRQLKAIVKKKARK